MATWPWSQAADSWASIESIAPMLAPARGRAPNAQRYTARNDPKPLGGWLPSGPFVALDQAFPTHPHNRCVVALAKRTVTRS